MPILDPVSGFEYPESWVAGIEPDARRSIETGFSILTADGTILRRGYTTGTTAAAAAKAAILSLVHPVLGGVSILTPAGIRVFVQSRGEKGHGESRKFSGDYPEDVTSGLCFHADANPAEAGVSITTGIGIGIWERDNPRFRKGTPAISPPAWDEILGAVTEALTETDLNGVRVCISAKDGVRIAEKTLNAKIGVAGGISILGSTGFVEPWDDHLEDSVLERVSGSRHIVLTTGRVGLRYSRLLFPGYDVVLVGSRLGPALQRRNGDVIICGLPALILKFINPVILDGSGYGSVEEMIGTPDFAIRAEDALARFRSEYPDVRVILLDREGRVIRETR
jgi:cobalt-precorrin-5B (C1)-methyltransferase